MHRQVAGSQSDVENKVLEANPLLEAFGNAKTLRNNNSSRFGKWVEIHFNICSKIVSARMDNYLLEKSRLVRQQKNERNFHIFYQLFSDKDMKKKYKLSKPSDFYYMSQSGCVKVPGIDDAREFDAALRALRALNFTPDQVDFITGTTAGLLFLGNLQFADEAVTGTADKGSKVTTLRDLKQAAELLGVDMDVLKKAVTNRTIVVGATRTVIPLSKTAAADAKDAIAKAIYGKLFDWLVKHINKATDGDRGKFVGVLDIFGFEIFDTNSFEQLCINYANEKLQQHFNKHTFKEEEAVYLSEEIKYTKIPFIDNQPVLNLIEKKPKGLLVALDDAIRVGKATDETWMKTMDTAHQKKKCFPFDPKLRRKFPLKFMVQHYAGKVVYDGDSFIEKNRDMLFLDGYEMMAGSKCKFMRTLFPKRKSGPTKSDSAGGKFRRQLTSLMKLLNRSEPGYIRCIKPNDTKSKNDFQTQMCIDQLRYSGVFEAVKIRKTGFPFRLTHQRFVARYRCILSRANGTVIPLEGGTNRVKNIKSIVKHAIADISDVVIGKTLVLYKAREHRLLQLMRHLALERLMPFCQAVVRSCLARELARRLRKAGGVIQKALDVGNDIALLDEAIGKVTGIIGSLTVLFPGYVPPEVAIAKTLRRKLVQWVKVTKQLEDLESKDANDSFAELNAAINSAESIMDIPHTAHQTEVYERAKERLNNCAASKIDPEARESLWLLDRDRMVAVLGEAQSYEYTNPDLEEISRLLKLPESAFVRLQLKRAVERKDPAMRINREIRLTEIYLEEHKLQFEFSQYAKLKHPIEFANSSFFPWGRDKLAEGMLKFTTKPVHTSMTEMGKASKVSKNLHKCILGYMGDRQYTNPAALVLELFEKGVESEVTATEIFCLLIKQMTGNPVEASRQKGIELMALGVSILPISADFEYYLMTYFNSFLPRPQNFISTLHERKYAEDPKLVEPVPAVGEITKLIDRVLNRQAGRSRYSISKSSAGYDDARSAAKTAVSLSKSGKSSKKSAPDSSSDSSSDEVTPPAAPPTPGPASKTAIDSDLPVAVAWWDFVAQDDSMMSFEEGDKLRIVEQPDDGWWKARSEDGQREGYIPSNYVKMQD